jgi:hypothetical protein
VQPRGDADDPRRRRGGTGGKRGQKQAGEQERRERVNAEGLLETIGGEPARGALLHDPGAVEQHIERCVSERGGEAADGCQARQVERVWLDGGTRDDSADRGGGGGGLIGVTGGEQDAVALSREELSGGAAEAAVAASDEERERAHAIGILSPAVPLSQPAQPAHQ